MSRLSSDIAIMLHLSTPCSFCRFLFSGLGEMDCQCHLFCCLELLLSMSGLHYPTVSSVGVNGKLGTEPIDEP